MRLLVYEDFRIARVIHSVTDILLSYYIGVLDVSNFLTVAAIIYDLQALSRRQ